MAAPQESAPRPDAAPRRADRRPELDAIRLVVVYGLVCFHAALVFDTRDDYYVKNATTTEATTWLAGLCVVWAMPALFLIAGLGSWHSIRRRGPGGFVRERLLRLGVPLLVASLTILPLPPWLRLKAADPGYTESYPRFLLRYFDVHLSLSDLPFLVQGEYFESGHLWFVVLLLAFSALLAALAAWLPSGRVARIRDAAAGATARRGVVLLPALPLAVIGALLGMEEAFAGWSRWAYLLFFLYGFALAADDRFRAAMRRDAVPAAVAGVVLFAAAGYALDVAGDDPFTDMTVPAAVARVLFALAGWCWLVAILGLLDRRRTAPVGVRDERHRPVYDYLSVAALPMYVLHQPIVVAAAYLVVRWQLPAPVKYLAIVGASFVAMFAVYELVVRRTRLTRRLFGIRG
ncbi:acyltransferase family protein [Dactylosporangium aurantiacum]|uniref:Acyltransferase family protein n=1 Tax=Dactylosporangium aurantiacum TaxID=35754 RepID=A0A9Q9MKI5_9ACTN|nr:acyltransferase family protein [Dactylosporangium aurantiacum]MDG6105800.1 acyltransferase family protein [Dactylosporangium aurantiacum]UWZ58015.1 acyltransferase family protein [Dactylosporangium aurantiacum]